MGDFTWVGVHSISGRSGRCPRGLSPWCHRNDGTFDVVLLAETDAKEVTKFVRAMGGTTGPCYLNLPSVQTYRCTAMRFQPRADYCQAPQLVIDEFEKQERVETTRQEAGYTEKDGRNVASDLGSDDTPKLRTESSGTQVAPLFDGASGLSSPEEKMRKVSLADLLCDSNSSSSSSTGKTKADSAASRCATGSYSETDETRSLSDSDTDRRGETRKKASKVGKNKYHDRSPSRKAWSARVKKLSAGPKSIAAKFVQLFHTTPGLPNDVIVSSTGQTTVAEIARQRRQEGQLEKLKAQAVQEAVGLLSQWSLEDAWEDEIDATRELEFRCYPNALKVFCTGLMSEDDDFN